MSDVPEGFEVPVLHALLRPKLIWGIPRDFAIYTIMVIGIAFIRKWLPVIPFGLLVLYCARLGTKHDPDWFKILPRCLKYHTHYGI
jgi:type IV secretory pathway TrbD component